MSSLVRSERVSDLTILHVHSELTANFFQVMAFDVLNNLRSDCLLLFKHRINLPTVVYFISRYLTHLFDLCLSLTTVHVRLGALSYALIGAIFPSKWTVLCLFAHSDSRRRQPRH